MNDTGPLFCYHPAESPVHRIPACYKLAGLVVLTILVFSGPLPVLPVAGLFVAILASAAHMPFRVIFRNICITLWYAAFIIMFRFIGPIPALDQFQKELAESGIYIARLFLVLLAGTVFYETTGTIEIFHTLKAFQSRLERIVYVISKPFTGFSGKSPDFPDIASLLSLTIAFIPRIFATWTALNRSWDARGGKHTRGLSGTWKRCTVLVPLLVISMLSTAANTDRAMRNRSL